MPPKVSEDLKALIKEEYQTTSASLRALSQKYGISKSYLGDLCKKGEWVKTMSLTKKVVRSKIRQEVDKRVKDKVAIIEKQTPAIINEKVENRINEIVEKKTDNVSSIADRVIALKSQSLVNLKTIQEKNTEAVSQKFIDVLTKTGDTAQITKPSRTRLDEVSIEEKIMNMALKMENPDREKVKLEVNNTFKYSELVALGDEVIRFIKGEGEYV